MSDKKDIKEVAYELYKEDWVKTHISKELLEDSRQDYLDYGLECRELGMKPYSYEDFILENGYGGMLYVCFDEFLEYEYLDKNYIEWLLKDKKLIDQYRCDAAA